MDNSSPLQRSWKIFKKSFSVDTSEEPMYMMTRYHFGSSAATIAAFYNLFLIRQRVIKNAIYISRSNNPRVVKVMCGVIGSLYLYGLYILWHIPSLFAEVAVRNYWASEDAVTNSLMREKLEELLFSDARLKKILTDDGLKI